MQNQTVDSMAASTLDGHSPKGPDAHVDEQNPTRSIANPDGCLFKDPIAHIYSVLNQDGSTAHFDPCAFANTMARDPDLCLRFAEHALGIELEPVAKADGHGKDAIIASPALCPDSQTACFDARIPALERIVAIEIRASVTVSGDERDAFIEVNAGSFGVILSVASDLANACHADQVVKTHPNDMHECN